MSAQSLALIRPPHMGSAMAAIFLKAAYVLIGAADCLFLLALAAMLFRPPDLQIFPFDRVAFVLLLAVALARLLLRCDRLQVYRATWPMLALLALGSWGAISQSYDPRSWSVLAAQWIVPVAMFHLAATLFSTPESQRKLEWFSIAVLLYLSVTAVFWLLDLKSLIFPRFILDESIGIHSDRARGPFLQAVANGVCINVLAIVALEALDRRTARVPPSRLSIRGVLVATLFVTTPLALLATKTRAVWLAAVFSAVLIVSFARGRRSRAVVLLAALVVAVTAAFAFVLQTKPGELRDRLQDRSPVEFRLDMYRAGWQMFAEKPLLGWRNDAKIQPEIERRISRFHPEYYISHNTYLQVAIQHGAVGVLLYAWLLVVFFRLGARLKFNQPNCESPFDPGFGVMWRVMLCVYLLNASVVVMNYQFLNAYMFAIAGILAARQGSNGEETKASNEHRLPV